MAKVTQSPLGYSIMPHLLPIRNTPEQAPLCGCFENASQLLKNSFPAVPTRPGLCNSITARCWIVPECIFRIPAIGQKRTLYGHLRTRV
jgi:hypothetical protein